MFGEDGHPYMVSRKVIFNGRLSLCSNLSGIILYDTHLHVIIMESRFVRMTLMASPVQEATACGTYGVRHVTSCTYILMYM